MIFDDSRARKELGHASRPQVHAVEDSVRWFLDNDYVVGPRRHAVTVRMP
jgi:hypothetical protein